jgi:pyruvate,water dikinase
MTDPDWVPIMRQASAIVTNRGGRTSHAAIVSRELGLPCIVGTNNATDVIKTGQPVTVDCTEGEHGIIYSGLLKFKVDKMNIKKVPKTKTDIMINIGYPDEAFSLSFLPSNGVGLAREEFIINEYIRIHPMALVKFTLVKDPKIRKQINELTAGYRDKQQFFVDKLAMGVAIIAAAFYPRDVILRFSDFKTNEYVNLIGGKYFEPKEENPMIGWRGASRYYKEGYKEGFALECKAIKKAREEFGLTNLKVMIPVCRTPEEGKKVLEVMKKNGLVQGKLGLEVYVMCEIPANVI